MFSAGDGRHKSGSKAPERGGLGTLQRRRTDTDTDTLNSLETTILRILERHRGQENAVGRSTLVDQVNEGMEIRSKIIGPISERTVRSTIKHLVESHGAWIGSCPKGYFMIQTDQELLAACKYYHGYALSLLHVEAKLRKMSLAALLGQLSMEFGVGAYGDTPLQGQGG